MLFGNNGILNFIFPKNRKKLKDNMLYEIVKNGPSLVKIIERSSVEAAISEFKRDYDTKTHTLFVLPERYKVDLENPHDCLPFSRIVRRS